jgi:hypothetical protein
MKRESRFKKSIEEGDVRRVRISGLAKPVGFAVMVRVLTKPEPQCDRLEAIALFIVGIISGEHPIFTAMQTSNPPDVYVSQAGCRVCAAFADANIPTSSRTDSVPSQIVSNHRFQIT